MSELIDLIALFVVAFPLIVFLVLIVEIVRHRDGFLDHLLPPDLLSDVSDALIGRAA